MFKRFANHHSPVYDGTPDPKTFEDWIRGVKKLFDALQCPEEWKVGFAVFYQRIKPIYGRLRCGSGNMSLGLAGASSKR